MIYFKNKELVFDIFYNPSNILSKAVAIKYYISS